MDQSVTWTSMQQTQQPCAQVFMRCARSQLNWKKLEIQFQVFKIGTYCESLWLHRLGSWSPQLAQDVKCSHAYRHPLAMSQAVLDNVVPVGNTCFLYQALTWVFFLKTYIQTLKKELQRRCYIPKQNQEPKPPHQCFQYYIKVFKRWYVPHPDIQSLKWTDVPGWIPNHDHTEILSLLYLKNC